MIEEVNRNNEMQLPTCKSERVAPPFIPTAKYQQCRHSFLPLRSYSTAAYMTMVTIFLLLFVWTNLRPPGILRLCSHSLTLSLSHHHSGGTPSLSGLSVLFNITCQEKSIFFLNMSYCLSLTIALLDSSVLESTSQIQASRLSVPFTFRFYFYVYFCIFSLHVCLCRACVHDISRGQKKASDSLKLETVLCKRSMCS